MLVNKPTNVQVLGVSSTSLQLTWQMTDTSIQSSPASAAAVVSYYRVFYCDVNDAMSSEMDVTVEQQSAIITDLCPFCEYNMRVVANAVNGATVSSDEVTARTLSDGQCPPHSLLIMQQHASASYKSNIIYPKVKAHFLINWRSVLTV